MIAIVEGLNPMHFLSFVILFFCVIHSCCYLVRFEKLLMHSESPIDEVGEGDKVLGPILDGNISGNDSVVEYKGKRGGVRRDKKILPDVSKNLYRDVPTNLHPIVPFVDMRLGRSTAGGAYSLWLKLLNLEGYEFIDAEGKTFAEIGNKGGFERW